MQGLWKKLLWFIAIVVLSVFYAWAYSTLASIFMTTVPQNYQWVLALAIPLMREITVTLKACSKAVGGALSH